MLKHRKRQILITLSIFFSYFFLAQDHGFFSQVWLEQGLSQSSINQMVQDEQGFMWFATQDGLNRYDGRNMDHYNFRPFDKQSVSGDFIYSISRINNSLFVFTDKGIDRVDLMSLKIFNLQSLNEAQSVYYKSWAFNGNLYLLSRKGLTLLKLLDNDRYDTKPFRFADSALNRAPFIYSLCTDEQKNIYAATTNGIYACKQNETTFSKIFELGSDEKTVKSSHFNTIYYKEKRLFFTDQSYLYSLQLNGNNFTKLDLKGYGNFSSILVDKQNKIWLGTSDNGILIVSGTKSDTLFIEKQFKKGSTNRFTLQSNEITSLYQNPDSDDDIVWIGTHDAGAFNYSYSKNSFSLPTSLVSNTDLNYFGVAKDNDGYIWAGYNTGLLCINTKQRSYYNIDLSEALKIVGRPIEAVICDNNNDIWVAYGNSLFVIDKRTKKLILKNGEVFGKNSNQISKIVELDSNKIIICSIRGLAMYNKKENTAQITDHIQINGKEQVIENASAFLKDRKGNWWIGCSAGLIFIGNKGTNRLLQHNNSDPKSILSNRIMDIKETNDGNILVATTKGLSIISNEFNIENIYSAKGLPNNFIYGMLSDKKGRFWMSTNYGLSVFDPATRMFKSYDASDGVCINEFNSGGFSKSINGDLIFAGLGGIVHVDPEHQVINKSVKDIILRKLSIEGYESEPEWSERLKLSYGQNDLNFEFSVPDYSGDQNITLYYRFKNKDTNLIKINSSKLFYISFIDLAPGNYDLEVIAINKENARSKPYYLKFSIGDPFWSTWWFYLIIILITVLLSWSIYRARLKRKIEYIQQIEQIRKDENEKVRKAAALDLHDEFGNGLTRISMLIEMIRIHIPKDDKEANTLLDLVSQNSNRLYHGTKDFIWSINPGKDNMYEIIIRIKDYADELFYGSNVTFNIVGLTEDLRGMRQPPTAGRNIAMIFKEALSNVSKHANATHVKLIIEQDQNSVSLTIEDNGSGFERRDYKNSFGISNIEQRAARLSAKLIIWSEKNKGTKITIKVNKEHGENGKKTKEDHHS